MSLAIASSLLMPFCSVYLPGRRLPRLPSTVALSSKNRAESTTPASARMVADLAGVGVLGDRDGDVALGVPVERLEGRVGDVQQAEEDRERDHGEDPAAPVAVARAAADVRGRRRLAGAARARWARGACAAWRRRTRRAAARGAAASTGGGSNSSSSSNTSCSAVAVVPRRLATISGSPACGSPSGASCSSVWNDGVYSTVGWCTIGGTSRRAASDAGSSRGPAGCSARASSRRSRSRPAVGLGSRAVGGAPRAAPRRGAPRAAPRRPRLLARRFDRRAGLLARRLDRGSSRGASRGSSRGASTRGSSRRSTRLLARRSTARRAAPQRGSSRGASTSRRLRLEDGRRRRLLDRLRLTLHRRRAGLDVRRADGVLEGLRRQGRPARRAARSAAARARSSGLRVSERLPNNVRKG